MNLNHELKFQFYCIRYSYVYILNILNIYIRNSNIDKSIINKNCMCMCKYKCNFVIISNM